MSEFCFFGNSKFSSHKIRGGEFSKFFSEQIWQTLHLFAVIHLYHVFTIVGGCQVKTLIIEMLSFWSTIAPRPLSTGLVFRTDVALLIACEGEVWLPPEIGLMIGFLPFLKRESSVQSALPCTTWQGSQFSEPRGTVVLPALKNDAWEEEISLARFIWNSFTWELCGARSEDFY